MGINPEKTNYYYVRAEVFDLASFIVGHTIEQGEDIYDGTWKAIQHYLQDNPALGIQNDPTTLTLDFARTIEPVSEIRTTMFNNIAPYSWPIAGPAGSRVFLEAIKTIRTDTTKTSAADLKRPNKTTAYSENNNGALTHPVLHQPTLFNV